VAYDEELAARVRTALAERDDVSERKMFGGIAFMVAGNMCCGITSEDLMLRLGENAADEALDDPRARPMDFTGRPMKGYVYVDTAGMTSDADLQVWVDKALRFVTTLPPK
jgi:TfoX/Sxy family transcriptional regulator of competence genes